MTHEYFYNSTYGARVRHSTYTPFEKTDIVFLDEKHCKSCYSIIQRMASYNDIAQKSYERYDWNQQSVFHSIHHDYTFRPVSDEFYQTYRLLFNKNILLEEIRYLSDRPEYTAFINTDFFQTLLSNITKFLSEGSAYIRPDSIEGCSVTMPSVGGINADNLGFRLTQPGEFSVKFRGPYDSDGTEEERIGCGYRALTGFETSLLSVALSKHLPQYFETSWAMYGNIHRQSKRNIFGQYTRSSYSQVSLCLMPILCTKKHILDTENKPALRDIV